jgi:hypothetical protein
MPTMIVRPMRHPLRSIVGGVLIVLGAWIGPVLYLLWEGLHERWWWLVEDAALLSSGFIVMGSVYFAFNWLPRWYDAIMLRRLRRSGVRRNSDAGA